MPLIHDMFVNGKTYHEILENLREMGVRRGTSEISIRRLLANHNMRRKGHISDSDLEIAVSRAVNEVRKGQGVKV